MKSHLGALERHTVRQINSESGSTMAEKVSFQPSLTGALG
jgi:hypothetical protein